MPSRHLVLCIDGTWNDPSQKTNVWELFRRFNGTLTEVPEVDGLRRHQRLSGPELDGLYMEGVGAGGQRLAGGALGVGLHDRVLDMYVLASRLWQPGTQLWVFGFSRGAWAARSLAGFIAAAGLLTAAEAASPDAVNLANARWLAFKTKALPPALRRFWDDAGQPQPISLVGVWDTVGALGIPFFNGLRSVDSVERSVLDFADLDLSRRVAAGRHALSIDETRYDFTPTLWNARDGVLQHWFPGVHADVGGGYPQRGLADLSLQWMLAEVQALSAGALLSAQAQAGLAPNPSADRHEEATALVWQLRPRKPRELPDEPEALHAGVAQRLAARADWRPLALRRIRQLAAWFLHPAATPEQICPAGSEAVQAVELEVGASVMRAVEARKWWNGTGLRVRGGQRYRVVTPGLWTDKGHPCDAGGYASTGNWALQIAEWMHARRLARADWFRLVAAVHADPYLEARNADDGNVAEDVAHLISAHVQAADRDSQLEAVGADGVLEVARDGYLYLFANDNSAFYGNNDGTLQASITRLA